jgi:hypothetical protein
MSVFALYIALAILTGWLTSRKGYRLGWSMLLGAFGIIGLVVAVILPNKTNRSLLP